MPTARKAVVSDETIRVHAYHLWEREGRVHGRDQEYWHRAADELAALPMVAASKTRAARPDAKAVKVKAGRAVKPAVAVKE